jgi:glycosyltransferase involved in cell wall biosynthesis
MERSRPGVSVIIPTRDRPQYLLATLASVSAQTYRDVEVIVVTDGSSDATLSILGPIFQPRGVRHVMQAHAGPAAARNHGLAAASGEFIALLDDDDLWPPDKLQWQVAELRGHPEVVLVYGYMESFGTERSYRWPPPDGPAGWVRDAFLAKNWIRAPGQTLIRASAIRGIGGFDPTLWSADDWDVYLRLAGLGPFIYRHRHALSYRAHHDNLSKQAWRMFRHASRVHSRHAGRLPRPGNAQRWVRCRASILNTLIRDLTARCRAEVAKRRERKGSPASPRSSAVGGPSA